MVTDGINIVHEGRTTMGHGYRPIPRAAAQSSSGGAFSFILLVTRLCCGTVCVIWRVLLLPCFIS